MPTLTVPKPYEKNRLPDEFSEKTFLIGTTPPQSAVLWVPDRDVFIENATVTLAVDADAATANFFLNKADAGTAIASGTNITAAANLGSTSSDITVNTPLTLTITNSAASVTAGQQFGYEFSAATTGITWLSITVRYRTRFPR